MAHADAIATVNLAAGHQVRQRLHEQALDRALQLPRAILEIGAFDQQELTRVQATLEQLRNDLVTLAQQMKHHQDYMNTLEQKISEGEAYMLELEAAQHEYQTLDDLHTMTEQFRKLTSQLKSGQDVVFLVHQGRGSNGGNIFISWTLP